MCVCVIWWGVILMTLFVGIGKVVTLTLSWLNEFLAGVPLAGTTAIFFGIGLTMFLLPPVPGVPVYFAGGIILTEATKDVAGVIPLRAGRRRRLVLAER